MFIKIVLLVFYTCFLDKVNSFSATDANCHVMYTSGYGYNSFFHFPQESIKTGDTLYFNFSVMAPSNAHILLSPKISYSDKDIVYEIVLGAGKNTFSTIRKLGTSIRMSLNTPSILTKDEFKPFWISINKGNVDVGSGNSTLPLLRLEDSQPLGVNYFTFGAWVGVTATWIYDCKNVTNKVKKSEKLIASRRQLESYLLEDYDSFAIPVNVGGKLSINVSAEVDHIDLDLSKSTFWTTIKFNFMWFDPKLRWNPLHYKNITNFAFYFRQIWHPEFHILNAIDDGTTPMDWTKGTVYSDGRVEWLPIGRLSTKCVNPDITNWPWDSQICKIRLGLHSYPLSVKLVLQQRAAASKTILKTVGNEWQVEDVITTITTTDKSFLASTFQSNNPATLKVTVRLIRNSTPYKYIILLPVICVAIISQLSFIISPNCNSRIYLHLVSLVICALCLLIIDHKLPSHSSKTPVIMAFVSWLFIIIVVQTIITAFIMNLAKLNKDSPPSIFIRRLLENKSLRMIFLLPESGRFYDELEDIPETADSKFDNIWFMLSLIVDRLIFILSSLIIVIIAVSIYKVKND